MSLLRAVITILQLLAFGAWPQAFFLRPAAELPVVRIPKIEGPPTAGQFQKICIADLQPGSDLGAKINACIAPNTEVLVTTGGEVTTPIVINNTSNLMFRCESNGGAVNLRNGVTGNPAEPEVKITGTSQHVWIQGCLLNGDSPTGMGRNGHLIAIIGSGPTPADVHIYKNWLANAKGIGKGGAGTAVPAAGLYVYKAIDTNVEGNEISGNQYGILADTATNNLLVSHNGIFSNARSAIRTQDSAEKIVVGPGNDIEGNGINAADHSIDFQECIFSCELYSNWIEFNNGELFFGSSGNPGDYSIRNNIIIHGATPETPGASADFMADSSGPSKMVVSGNEFYLRSTRGRQKRFFDLNPDAKAAKIFRDNTFEIQPGTTIIDGIGWGSPGMQAGPCEFSNNTFGGTYTRYFAGINAISLVGVTVSGCHLENNVCFTNAGTLTNCINIGSKAINTVAISNRTGGSGTVTNLYLDQTSPPSTIYFGAGAPIGSMHIPGTLAINQLQISGTAPTGCIFSTGGGTNPSCSLDSRSTNVGGAILVATGTGSPGISGTVTLTFSNSPYGTTGPSCIFNWSNANSLWASGAAVGEDTRSPSSTTIAWSNNGVALKPSSTYRINYWCPAK